MSESLSNGDGLEVPVFPPLGKAFKGLLKPDGPTVSAFSRADRFFIKCTVQELARMMSCKERDVLIHYGIDVAEYFYRVDTVMSAEEPTKKRRQGSERRQLRHSSMTGYSATEKLRLLEQVDAATHGGQALCDACEAIGMHTRQYYSLDKQRARLQTQAWKEANAPAPALSVKREAETPPPRMYVTEESRQTVVDAANVLTLVGRESLGRAAVLLGVHADEVRDWKDESKRDWLFPPRRNVPLPRELLHIPTADKLRALDAFVYLERPLRQSRYAIATALGYREDTVRQWAKIQHAINRLKEQRTPDHGPVVSFQDVQKLCAETGETQPGLQTWLKANNLKDAYMQVVLRGRIGPGEQLEPEELMGLWELQWSGEIDGASLDQLVRYYIPAADYFAQLAVNKTRGGLDLDLAQSYARVGLLDVVRRYTLNHNTKFLTYAGIRITGEIWDGVRHDDHATRQARTWDKRLSDGASEWSMANGRQPTDAELIAHLGITPEKLFDIRSVLSSAHQVSLQDAQKEDEEGKARSRLDYVQDTREALPSDVQGEVLTTLLGGLNETQQKVVIGYYVEQKTMKQIGSELNLSESRISQMHTELLELLEGRILSHEGRDDVLGLVCQAYGQAEVA